MAKGSLRDALCCKAVFWGGRNFVCADAYIAFHTFAGRAGQNYCCCLASRCGGAARIQRLARLCVKFRASDPQNRLPAALWLSLRRRREGGSRWRGWQWVLGHPAHGIDAALPRWGKERYGRAERRCLPAARALCNRARPVWCFGRLAAGEAFTPASGLWPERAGNGCFRSFRRGHGGPCPHPLKGLVP